jgi:putative transposase
LYYQHKGENARNLKVMKLIDQYHTKHPAAGILSMCDMLGDYGLKVNHKCVSRLMKLMQILAIYPVKSLSKRGKEEYVCPYLLRNLMITKPNQVWSIDISYIPMRKGFMYLTAIIDVYSRFIVGWAISNTLDTCVSIGVLQQAILNYGKPDIINSDQGCQYTSSQWQNYLKEEGIQISMDGYKRAKDNIWIERFWRTIKREYVYLSPEQNGIDLYKGIKEFMVWYNYERHHQGINHEIPARKYGLNQDVYELRNTA